VWYNRNIFNQQAFLLTGINFNQLKPRLIELAQQNDEIELLWLYGSQAKGTAHSHSDVDLAVVFKRYEEDVLERRLRPELLAMDWQRALGLPEGQLSVLDVNIAPIPLSVNVLNDGQLLLCKNTSRLLREQQRIMSMWEIDYLHHHKIFKPSGVETTNG
jgi:predicted nucleotidyltransferase